MKFLSLNCWFHHLDKAALENRTERLTRIINFINERNADIVCLQECFHFYLGNQIFGSFIKQQLQLETSYICLSEKCESNWFACHQDSGLLTLCKHAPNFFLTNQFKTTGWFTRRGFYTSVYDEVWVVNLHLDAFSRERRRAQIEEIVVTLQACKTHWVLLGDFNISNENERKEIMSYIATSTNHELFSTHTNKNTHKDGCLDMAISTKQIVEFELHEGDLSDHFAISFRLC
jgi:endonuclease/exonuclease/phosphatase family metal-dependent hydrolase